MDPFYFIVFATGYIFVSVFAIRDIPSDSKHVREERSLIKIAQAAIHGFSARKYLLLGTKPLGTLTTDDAVKTVYFKYGDGARAKEDFYFTRPDNVKVDDMGLLRIGETGNRYISLDQRGSSDFAIIRLKQVTKGKLYVDEIRYSLNAFKN